MDELDGSLAGVPVARTAIAWVDPVRGAFVRGRPLAELARHSYEEAAAVVLDRTGAFVGALPAEREAAARALGRTLGPTLGLVAGLPLLEGDLPSILGALPALVAHLRGAPAPEGTYAARALAALGSPRTDPGAVRALEVLLVLQVEHGLSASTFACRVAASSGASPGAALAAAAATLSGPRHGGATADARAMLSSLEDVGPTVAAWRREKRILPGFGHRIYKGPDPRLPPLRAATAPLAPPLAPVAVALEEAVAAEYGGLHANIDLWGAVLLDGLGVAPELYVAAFALGVVAGWLAHYEEQRATGRLVRPDSVYVGR